MKITFYLFEDRIAAQWAPFALTRPVGELLFGTRLLRERAEGSWGAPCSGYLGRPDLEGFEEEGAPPVIASTPEAAEALPTLLVSSRVVAEDETGSPLHPDGELLARLGSELGSEPGSWEATLLMDDEVVGWIVPPGSPLPDPDTLARPGSSREKAPLCGRELRLEGRLLARPWDLVSVNASRLERDLEGWRRETPDGGWRMVEADAPRLPGVERLGDHSLFLAPGVEIEPGSVLDLRKGPVALGAGVRVRSFTLLEGPAYVGPGSVLLGGLLSSFSAGPVCKLRGELADSVILGFTNKAHDGHLGHAYLGRWVNLGAMTTNSDLKNNYGNVRVWTPEGDEDTGLMKVGCFLGDHVKTAIGTLVGTGSVVGAGSNLFGEGIVGRHVPPYTWGGGEAAGIYAVERFLDTARTAMARRGAELSPGMEALLRRGWERTAGRRGTAP